VLVVEKGMKRAELPISKNIIKMNGKSHEMNGLTILSAKTGKVYVSPTGCGDRDDRTAISICPE